MCALTSLLMRFAVTACYLPRYTGDRDVPLTWRSTLAYNWAIGIDGSVHDHPIKVRADNASSRGIPIPGHLRTAVRCRDLASRAAEAAKRVEAGDGIVDVDCKVAGLPKLQPRQKRDTIIGDVVPLCTPTGQTNFVLCAHIVGDMWYCHAGSFGSGGLEHCGQLDDENLVVKDVVADAQTDEKPTKRICPHARAGQLRELVDSSPESWNSLVAIATTLAEQKRAEIHGCDVDWGIALSQFEQDHWQWKAVEGRTSQLKVYFK